MNVEQLSWTAVQNFPVSSADHVQPWVEIMQSAFEAASADGTPNLDLWAQYVTEGSRGSVDPAALEAFLWIIGENGGLELVAYLLQNQAHLLEMYAIAHAERQNPETALAWVTEEQRTALEQYFGSSWAQSAVGYLEEQWGSRWNEYPADQKVTGLDALLTGGGQAADEETARAEESLSPDEAVRQVIDLALGIPGFAELSNGQFARLVHSTINANA
ncbi:hypothetical protein ACFT8P_33390 [Streptomyces sp. NPDC057101]|uniref:hypothetical protein n=1 Tax=Streptomyces sp. NPDC057101 TaxID=3346020 RepID=UPI00362CF085